MPGRQVDSNSRFEVSGRQRFVSNYFINFKIIFIIINLLINYFIYTKGRCQMLLCELNNFFINSCLFQFFSQPPIDILMMIIMMMFVFQERFCMFHSLPASIGWVDQHLLSASISSEGLRPISNFRSCLQSLSKPCRS